MSQFLVSAAHKSSGKTTLSIGLCAALHRLGHVVQPFKKGPDYIDPIWLSMAAGQPCYNLDFQQLTREENSELFQRLSAPAQVVLVEGNKGLYDGLDIEGSNSNAAMAQLLGLPVILVIDVRGVTRGVAPLILGYQAFDRDIRIQGVILNQVGGARHEGKLRAIIEHYTDVPVLGAVQHDPALQIDERHLGLIPGNEADAAVRQIDYIARSVAEQVDLERLLQVTGGVPACAGTAAADCVPDAARYQATAVPRWRIGIVRDRAFGFYYADDLDRLTAAGATLVEIDALADPALPELDGLVIGGGFPELFARELEANAPLRAAIRHAIDDGLPVYAECGGLMYLARSLSWRGETRQMVGAIDGDVVMHERPVGRGYVRLSATADSPWPVGAGDIHGHEFHYSSLENLPADTMYAWRVERGHGIDGRNDGIVHGNLLASYAHLRSSRQFSWVDAFLQRVMRRAGGDMAGGGGVQSPALAA